MFKERKESKVSLNIKVTPDLNARLKNLRERARGHGLIFNVSSEVIDYLEKRVKRAEKEMDELDKEAESQASEYVENTPKKASDAENQLDFEGIEEHPALQDEDNSLPSEVENKNQSIRGTSDKTKGG